MGKEIAPCWILVRLPHDSNAEEHLVLSYLGSPNHDIVSAIRVVDEVNS